MSKNDPRQDLRSTEESIERDATRVLRLEEEKMKLDPADSRVDEISVQVERVAVSLETKSRAEREISEEIKHSE